jgi:hypothetical protein
MRDYPINRVLTAQGSIVILYIIIKIIFQQLLNLYNMKKSAFLALFLAVFIFNNAQAAILTVNNTDPSPAQYSTIAAAIAAAADNVRYSYQVRKERILVLLWRILVLLQRSQNP